MSLLVNTPFFTIDNIIFKQFFGLPTGIDLEPFCFQHFLHFFESHYIKQLISSGSYKVHKYHAFSWFIDDLCAINDGNEFLTSFKKIYPKELKC